MGTTLINQVYGLGRQYHGTQLATCTCLVVVFVLRIIL